MSQRNQSLVANSDKTNRSDRTVRNFDNWQNDSDIGRVPSHYNLLPRGTHYQTPPPEYVSPRRQDNSAVDPLPTSLPTSSCRTSDRDVSRNHPKARSRRHAENFKALWSGEKWLWEITATILSIFTLAASIVLLGRYNGKPLHEWHLFISINTVISIMATASRTTLDFSMSSCLGRAK
jgi:hypothetical protein